MIILISIKIFRYHPSSTAFQSTSLVEYWPQIGSEKKENADAYTIPQEHSFHVEIDGLADTYRSQNSVQTKSKSNGLSLCQTTRSIMYFVSRQRQRESARYIRWAKNRPPPAFWHWRQKL